MQAVLLRSLRPGGSSSGVGGLVAAHSGGWGAGIAWSAQGCNTQEPAQPALPCCLGSQAYQLGITRGMAFKKAGGTARQNPQPPSKNKGVRYLQDELVFPGHIILTQHGTKYHPGEGVGKGKDHTIFATSVGLVKFGRATKTFGDGRKKTRTTVKVVPVNGDRSAAYKAAEREMIARRAVIKRTMLVHRAHEAAFFFPLPPSKQAKYDALHARINQPLPSSAARSTSRATAGA